VKLNSPITWIFFAVLMVVVGAEVRASSSVNAFSVEGDAELNHERVKHILSRYQLSLEPPIDMPDADDAAYYLAEFLRTRGYPDALVRYSFGRGEVIFQVSRGERIRFGGVNFQGREILPADRMRAIFENAMRQVTLTPFGPVPFTGRGADQAVRALLRALEDEGYASAEVDMKRELVGRQMHLTVEIEEGPLHVVREVAIWGAGIPPPLLGEAEALRGETYSPGIGAHARSQMLLGLQNAGFFDASVGGETLVGSDGNVHITMDVDPGRRYRLGNVSIEGNARSLSAAVLGRLRLKSGGFFDNAEIDQALRRLWKTSAFSEVEPVETPQPDGTIDLLVRLEEARARDISITVGYGQWEQGFAKVTFTDRNFFGTLNRAFITGVASFRTLGAIGGISDPFFLGSESEGTLTGYVIRRETPAYRSTFYGAGFSLERTLDPANATGWRAGFAWRASENTTLFGDDDPGDAEIDYRLGELTFGQTWDRRDDPINPKSGFFLSWDAALASKAFAGDISFGRVEGQATAYFPLIPIQPSRPFVPFIVLNHRAGIILPYGDTGQVPVQERFFLGGPDSVRGFQLDGMPPRSDNGVPTGGELSLLVNAEIQIPVLAPLYGIGFIDAGNLATTADTFDWDETRIAAGLGARLYTPLGAVRIDYGYNLIRGPGDPIGAWQLGFGFTF
jgi:outer membrane protein insertion porin family